MHNTYEKVALIIMDGWGHGLQPERSAIAQANTPFVDSLYQNYPNAELTTHGKEVGLPEGQMGNSEVGHLNIGAGRIVYQELERINVAIDSGEFQKNEVLLEAFNYAKQHNKKVHLLGLVSDGGVHSHLKHLTALCQLSKTLGTDGQTFIHAFLDGRDTSPTGGVGYLNTLLTDIENTQVRLASMIGRYYAMDRDKRWERVLLAYDLLTQGKGTVSTDLLEDLKKSYQNKVTDEFIQPHITKEAAENQWFIKEGDVVICYNFRTDRCREITEVLSQTDMPNEGMKRLKGLHYVTMSRYDETFEQVKVVFEKDDLKNTLGQVLADANKTQLRMAETEKYPHVTFFFSGGREEPFRGETRQIINSPKVATYDQQPEMSAYVLAYTAIEAIRKEQPNFVCINFANSDMVGHTGDFKAAMQAAETVDFCVSKLTKVLLEHNYAAIIIADHGNSDYMINDDGSPNTAHTTNLVPIIFMANDTQGLKLKSGKLGDVAPSILNLMGLQKPDEMTGDVLFS
jgi:2,3-bisphosphoglycerate-independent phosphoglycerate mutase